MELILKQTIKVKSYEVDYTGKMKLSALFYILQEIAYNHAVILNVGFKDLLEKKKFWVLSRMKILINEYPKWDDQIELQTWPKKVEKVFTLRDFMIYGNDNRHLVSATSLWMVLDLETKQVQRISSLIQDIPVLSGQHAVNETPGKITIDSTVENYLNQKVLYSDIDVNNHVNNAKYVEWLLNSFNMDFYRENIITALQINFMAEAIYEDTLLIGRVSCGKNEYAVEGIAENSKAVIFRAIVEWRTRSQ